MFNKKKKKKPINFFSLVIVDVRNEYSTFEIVISVLSIELCSNGRMSKSLDLYKL